MGKILQVSLAEVGLLSVRDVCDRLGCVEKSVQNWINAGLLPVVIVGKSFLIREKDLKSFKRPARGRPKA